MIAAPVSCAGNPPFPSKGWATVLCFNVFISRLLANDILLWWTDYRWLFVFHKTRVLPARIIHGLACHWFARSCYSRLLRRCQLRGFQGSPRCFRPFWIPQVLVIRKKSSECLIKCVLRIKKARTRQVPKYLITPQPKTVKAENPELTKVNFRMKSTQTANQRPGRGSSIAVSDGRLLEPKSSRVAFSRSFWD